MAILVGVLAAAALVTAVIWWLVHTAASADKEAAALRQAAQQHCTCNPANADNCCPVHGTREDVLPSEY
jgi:hypothetical protein